ncbi:unnamed protein product [Peronospora belbahrii]|uniref:PDZ domain-containing protein n=1 Tax=Peronospora belbahrii TaxID=622444 RepID=A0AAU9L943_9STRA|nr:unnamed protein product [Peronospora belbahrii]
MGESLTIRLFVCTQTYDIPCDPRQSIKWLLMQAKTIQRSNQKHLLPEDELEVLFNRTTRQTPNNSHNNAMLPWFRSYPGSLQLSSDKIDSSNGLFFQQLHAYTLIGKRTPVSAVQLKQKHDQDAFLALVHTYVTGNYDQDNRSRPQAPNTIGNGRKLKGNEGCSTASSGMHAASSRENYYAGTRRSPVLPSSAYPPKHDPSGFSDSGSDSSVEDLSSYPARSLQTNEHGVPQSVLTPSSPVHVPTVSSPSIPRPDNTLDGLENVFDIVFKQQAIGMKLGADETKQYAIVKECFDGSEAKRYPEIQSGVVILAVNGQEVSGLGLSRVLYRLREAPRPVVVRFGRMSTRQLQERRKARGPW